MYTADTTTNVLKENATFDQNPQKSSLDSVFFRGQDSLVVEPLPS